MSTKSPDNSDSTDSNQWDDIGRELLAEKLEIRAGDLREAFLSARSRIQSGEELTEKDINELRHAIEQAEHVVETAAEASPEAAPAPDMWQFLDEDARAEYKEEAMRRLSETGASE